MVKKLWQEERSTITRQEELLEHWKYADNKQEVCVGIRHFYSLWGDTKQVFIQKVNSRQQISMSKFATQPTMAEKREVLQATKALKGIKNCVAMEIFPRWKDIVDDYDLYHMWLVSSDEIPFALKAAYKVPRFLRLKNRFTMDGVTYKYTFKVKKEPGVKPVTIYYVKLENGQEMSWYQKQHFKDFVIGRHRIAIEFQRDEDYDFAIFVKIPLTQSLPFGLTSTISKNNFEEEKSLNG